MFGFNKEKCEWCGHPVGECTCAEDWDDLPVTTTEDCDTSDEFLIDLLDRIGKACDIAKVLIADKNADHLWCRIFEDIYEDAQCLVDEYCVDD